MTEPSAHLTEDERQTLGDRSIDPERSAALIAHLGSCADCADDVARIRMLMTRAREATVHPEGLDELWPAIRLRIEARKVVALAPTAAEPAPRRRALRRVRVWTGLLGAAAAAAAVTVVLVRGDGSVVPDVAVPGQGNTTRSFVTQVDSAQWYEAEAQTLLDRLELQRAVLRPEAARALERDLRSIDVAIIELKDAIARDPGNPALRQLLASSYRQKIDLLKRASNAS